jgi:hypothetical protein
MFGFKNSKDKTGGLTVVCLKDCRILYIKVENILRYQTPYFSRRYNNTCLGIFKSLAALDLF